VLRTIKTKEAKLSTDTYRENGRLTWKEKSILGEAEYHNPSPMLSITLEAKPSPWHAGQWRQMGAVSHQLHTLKPSVDGAVSLQPHAREAFALVHQLRKPRKPPGGNFSPQSSPYQYFFIWNFTKP
jgi:hypothetical protein